MNKLVIISILILQCGFVNSQKIDWQELQFQKVNSISKKNDTLVNPNQIPQLTKTSGLVDKISSTEIFLSKDEIELKIKSEFDKIVSSYINKNNITDNNEVKDRYAITKSGHQYELKKHKTLKRYLFWEGAGVQSYISIDESPGYSENDIYCIFDDNIDYQNSKFSIFTISPQNGKSCIEPNNLINFKDNQNNYEFTYLADLCDGIFEYKGRSTIFPTYFNLELSVKDVNSGKIQTLLQIPHEHIFRLSKIQLADINSDKRLDVILQLETDLCSDRIIYLSSQNNGNDLFKYIGRMMIYCDYP
jgi:hypothetical protein